MTEPRQAAVLVPVYRDRNNRLRIALIRLEFGRGLFVNDRAWDHRLNLIDRMGQAPDISLINISER